MSNSVEVYFEALYRLIADTPKNVPSGTKISNDSVSVEAGRGKGSIKKSRLIFSDLIEAIRIAAGNQFQAQDEVQQKIANAKKDTLNYKKLYEAAIGRELSLIYEIDELKQTINQLTIGKVTGINKRNNN